MDFQIFPDFCQCSECTGHPGHAWVGSYEEESCWEKMSSLVWGMLTLSGSQPFMCRCHAGRALYVTVPGG